MSGQDIMALIGIPLAGWVIKEVIEIRPLKENVDHIRERVDELYSHLIEGPGEGRGPKR